MFTPPPPREPDPLPLAETESETAANIANFRHRARWPWLLRLAGLFRMLAGLSLVAGILGALVGMVVFMQGNAAGIVYSAIAMVSGICNLIFCMGMAELVLLFIALEKNTRQTRDRIPKQWHDEAGDYGAGREG